jgi:hypothetical protein
MAWALWLAAPLAVTLVVAAWSWLRARPPRPPTTAQAMQAHRDYLDALVVPARGDIRTEPTSPRSPF